jgi:aminoglycoside phosphotransferase (APT) family kinase protein
MSENAPDFLDRPTTMRPGEELPLSSLGPFLRRQFPDSTGPLVISQFPGGHSNLTFFVRLGSLEMVLRRPPFRSEVKTAHDMQREYSVLAKLHEFYPRAPKVVVYCDDESVLGARFYLMERIRGIILRRDPPPELPFSADEARRLSESFVDNLGCLHRMDYGSMGLRDLGKPEGYMGRQVSGWIERYHKSETEAIPEVRAVARWLQEHLPATSDTALIHNDYKYDNLVLDADDITRIIGVLDWEMCTIGDPLADLGTALAYWVEPKDSKELLTIRWGPTHHPGSLTRAQLVERYARVTGRDVSRISFYLTFARFKAAVIAQQIFHRYHRGFTGDLRFASMIEKARILMRSALESAESSTL